MELLKRTVNIFISPSKFFDEIKNTRITDDVYFVLFIHIVIGIIITSILSLKIYSDFGSAVKLIAVVLFPILGLAIYWFIMFNLATWVMKVKSRFVVTSKIILYSTIPATIGRGLILISQSHLFRETQPIILILALFLFILGFISLFFIFVTLFKGFRVLYGLQAREIMGLMIVTIVPGIILNIIAKII